MRTLFGPLMISAVLVATACSDTADLEQRVEVLENQVEAMSTQQGVPPDPVVSSKRIEIRGGQALDMFCVAYVVSGVRDERCGV
jgi:hypothetical protein